MKAVAKKVSARNVTLDWVLLLANLWFVIGVYVDGWAHNHLHGIETFFTPWHALLYSGFGVSALVILVACWLNHRKGMSWKNSAPSGYGLGFLGVVIFMLGGMGDMTWHIIFGVEADVDALLSPTHLMLAVGAVLMIASPLRAAYREKHNPKGWEGWVPVIMSATMILAILTFMSQYGNPIAHPWAEIAQRPVLASAEDADFYGQAMGIGGILFYAALLSGMALTMLRRWALPIGTFFIMLGLTTLAMSFMHDTFYYVPGAFAAGFLLDCMIAIWRPFGPIIWLRRMFAFFIPAVFFVFYFLAVFLNGGTWWTIHFWTGAIVLPGLVGLLMSYLESPIRSATSTTK